MSLTNNNLLSVTCCKTSGSMSVSIESFFDYSAHTLQVKQSKIGQLKITNFKARVFWP